MHEQPAVMAERVAVGLLHGAADRRPDMREEQRRADVAGELAQVVVVPGRFGAAEDARRVGGAVPTDAEPVAVGRLGPELRGQALVRRASWAPRRAPPGSGSGSRSMRASGTFATPFGGRCHVRESGALGNHPNGVIHNPGAPSARRLAVRWRGAQVRSPGREPGNAAGASRGMPERRAKQSPSSTPPFDADDLRRHAAPTRSAARRARSAARPGGPGGSRPRARRGWRPR